ncbi:MAG TPA: HAD family hydrolase [Sedimentisphaerales bacterium]|nr:HAD family hydrolase [Sedimentisphaerales bacterium]
MIKTVVFDLDDTLYDEIDYCKSGLASVADFLADLPETPNARGIFDCLWKEFTAGNRTKTFNAALDRLGIDYDEKLIRELVKVYRNHVPKITLPADSKNVLDRLSRKYTLALLTDGFLPAQQLKVHALGIEKYFKTIIYTEQLGREFWKPSPAGFQRLIEALNVPPETAAYIADNEKKDFIAPNNLGLLTIQIVRPARLHTESSDQPGAAALHIIRKISRIPDLLERL